MSLFIIPRISRTKKATRQNAILSVANKAVKSKVSAYITSANIYKRIPRKHEDKLLASPSSMP